MLMYAFVYSSVYIIKIILLIKTVITGVCGYTESVNRANKERDY